MKTVFMAQENIDSEGNTVFEVVADQSDGWIARCHDMGDAEDVAGELNAVCETYERFSGITLNARPE